MINLSSFIMIMAGVANVIQSLLLRGSEDMNLDMRELSLVALTHALVRRVVRGA